MRAGLECGLLQGWVRDPAQGIGVLRRATAALERSGVGDEALAASVHHVLGTACWYGGRTQDALVPLRAALGWFDRHGSPHGRGEAQADLACVPDNLGRLDEALTHTARSPSNACATTATSPTGRRAWAPRRSSAGTRATCRGSRYTLACATAVLRRPHDGRCAIVLLLDTAEREVPVPFCGGFLQRDPVNRDPLASRHTARLPP